MRRAALVLLLAIAAVAGGVGGWFVNPPQRSTAAATKAPRRSASPPVVTPTPMPTATSGVQRRVVLFGDGLLDGNTLPDAQSLPVLLASARSDLMIVDLGLGHETSANLLDRIRGATSERADEVVLWVGTYDALQHVPVTDYSANLQRLLDALQVPHIVLLPPIAVTGAPAHGEVPYRDALTRVAQAHGLTVRDISGALQNADYQNGGQDLGPNADAALAGALAHLL